MLVCAGSLTFTACERMKKTDNTSETAVSGKANNGGVAATEESAYEAEYRDRAKRFSSRLAADVHYDPAMESRVQDVYSQREKRVTEIRNKYQANSRNGGTMDTTGMYQELQAVDVEIDNEFRSILPSDQFRTYETNRNMYWTEGADEPAPSLDIDNTNAHANLKVDDDELKVKTQDIKVKAEPGKSKVETENYESKIKGEERKYKDSNTKIKSEPGKMKYETPTHKIKIKERD